MEKIDGLYYLFPTIFVLIRKAKPLISGWLLYG